MIPIPEVHDILCLHDLPGMGNHKETAVVTHGIHQFAEALTRKGRILEMSFRTAFEIIFRKSRQDLLQFRGIGKQHVVVETLLAGMAVRDRRSGFRPANEERIIPFRQIHVPHLTVIQNGGEIHLQFRHLLFPDIQRAVAIAGAA